MDCTAMFAAVRTMRRPATPALALLAALTLTTSCTRQQPAPAPQPRAGEVLELLPDGIKPPELRGHSWELQEPVALLQSAEGADVVVSPPRGPGATIYRRAPSAEGRPAVTFYPTDGDIRNQLADMNGVSSAARSADGTTRLLDNPSGQRNGTPRLLTITPGGRSATFSALTELRLSRDRVRLTTLPDGRVGYLADGRLHHLPGDSGHLPALTGVERITPTGDGGYLAAVRPAAGRRVQVVRIDARGVRSTLTVPAEVSGDPLRNGAGPATPVRTSTGTVVALASDGAGGAYLAIADKSVDDSLGVDYQTRSMILRMKADGATKLLLDGRINTSAYCPTLARATRLATAEREVGRVTDLLVRDGQLWIADAACRRILALQLR